MRTKLGLVVASMTVASMLTFAVPASASPDGGEASADEPVEAPVDTAEAPADSSTTTTTTSTTTTSTTTTTIAGEIARGVNVEVATRGTQAAPDRAAEQTQIKAPPPPPTTTTTIPTFGLPGNSGSGRRAVYSKSAQTVWAVNSNGVVIKHHRVSGKQVWCDPTPGTYSVYSRSRYTFALQNPSIIWGYMVRFAKGCQGGNIGFHEIPTDKRTGYKVQSVSQLGTPLSGGCVRQAIPDAQWMWSWAQVGTKVVVLP